MSLENPNEFGELKEYSFEEGLKVSLEKIKELFDHSENDVIIVINGSGTNVGKSYLVNSLSSSLMRAGFRVDWLLYGDKKTYESIRMQNKQIGIDKSFYFMQTQGLAYSSTEAYKKLWREGGHLTGDIFIGIYRPDKPFVFSEREKQVGFAPLADILIRNDGAYEDDNKITNDRNHS